MLKVITILLIIVHSAEARAVAASRVVLVDAVVFTPALEKKGARQRMEESVEQTLKQHGWERVVSATECHSAMCAGPTAAGAGTAYALILSGAFVPGELYADDVGVQLSRDGGVIASRTEKDEEADSRTVGAGTFLSCGPPTGACTDALLTSKLMSYSAKVLDDETAAIHARGIADAKAAAAAQPVVVSPVPVAPPPTATPREGGVGRLVGWSLVGGGVALGAGAVILWAFNNDGTDCHSVAGDPSTCRNYHHTTTAAVLVGGAGLVAAAAGVVLLVLDCGSSNLALSVQPNSFVLGGTF